MGLAAESKLVAKGKQESQTQGGRTATKDDAHYFTINVSTKWLWLECVKELHTSQRLTALSCKALKLMEE